MALQESPRIKEARELADKVLILLREERSERQGNVNGKDGKRELSEAITNFETGCMFMIRSLFADQDYTPLNRFKKVN